MAQGAKVAIVLAAWLLVVIGVSISGLLLKLRPPAPQAILGTLTLSLLVWWRMSVALQVWLRAIDLRALVALHLTRFVGFYFLLLCQRGELPCSFAMPAGWGDVLVAILAGALLVGWRMLPARDAVLLTWNTLGLLDIFFVVINAGRHAMADASSMNALLHLPLSLLPTFLVPLIITSHVVILSRIASQRR